jgi:hypothetical protein
MSQVAHSKCLRIIGQAVEAAKLPVFEIETDGGNYVLRSNSMSAAGEWILRHAVSPYGVPGQRAHQTSTDRSVRFTLADISRLDQEGQKQRRIGSAPQAERYRRTSQLLRALGDHCDRAGLRSFHISWTPSLISIDFHSEEGQRETRTFTLEKLEQLGSSSRFRRPNPGRQETNLLGTPRNLRPGNR